MNKTFVLNLVYYSDQGWYWSMVTANEILKELQSVLTKLGLLQTGSPQL